MQTDIALRGARKRGFVALVATGLALSMLGCGGRNDDAETAERGLQLRLPTAMDSMRSEILPRLEQLHERGHLSTTTLIEGIRSGDAVTRVSACYLALKRGRALLPLLNEAILDSGSDEAGWRIERLERLIQSGKQDLGHHWELIDRHPNGDSLSKGEFLEIARKKVSLDPELLRATLAAPQLQTRLEFLQLAGDQVPRHVEPIAPDLIKMLKTPHRLLPRGVSVDSTVFHVCRHILGDPRVLLLRAIANTGVELTDSLHGELDRLAGDSWTPLAMEARRTILELSG